MSGGEILVVPKNGQGHFFPCMELCKHLISRNYNITLIIINNNNNNDNITSSIHSSLLHSPLFHVSIITPSSSPPDPQPQQPPFLRLHQQMSQGIESLLTRRDPGLTRPVCAVVDHIMNKTQEVFWKFGIPTCVFITSGAAWAAVQHAAWVVRPGDMRPGEVRALPGLPEEMVLSYSDLKQRRHWLPLALRGGGAPHEVSGGMKLPRGPPLPGEVAPWVEEVENSVAILINTCDDLERPFLDYVANLTRKPVFGVGPLLSGEYLLRSLDTGIREREIRPKRETNYSDDEIIEWLDSKPRGSVMFVSFGSEVGPSVEEYPELAKALEVSIRPFIWVIQRGESYFPHGLDNKVGERGLIIHGWAPQLLIFNHPSTGGFVSHCGWNSTVEAILRGVPLLAWPIRGDQYYNAKLVVSHLKIGALVSQGYPADMVTNDDIVKGIEKVLTDEEIRKRSAALCEKFKSGFPASSQASLDAFSDFISQRAA